MPRAVLDSSAVLAVLNQERGAENVIAVLPDAVMSTVNVAEVIGKLVERGRSPDHARRALEAIGLEAIDYDRPLAERTGELVTMGRERGLSLGDRACLALAEREQAPAITADRSWQDAVPGVDIRLIR
jgi:ribonuclease VapC